MKWFDSMSSGGKAAVIVAFLIFGLPVVSFFVLTIFFTILSLVAMIFGVKDVSGESAHVVSEDSKDGSGKPSLKDYFMDAKQNHRNLKNSMLYKHLSNISV